MTQDDRAGPDPREEPEAFLRALFAEAVAVADPMRFVPAHLPPRPPGRVLVVGAGAAGLAAARVAGASGARVILCDRDTMPGGGLLIEPAQEAWRVETLAALAAMPEVEILTRTNVFGYYDHNHLGAVEVLSDGDPVGHRPRQRRHTIRARTVRSGPHGWPPCGSSTTASPARRSYTLPSRNASHMPASASLRSSGRSPARGPAPSVTMVSFSSVLAVWVNRPCDAR